MSSLVPVGPLHTSWHLLYFYSRITWEPESGKTYPIEGRKTGRGMVLCREGVGVGVIGGWEEINLIGGVISEEFTRVPTVIVLLNTFSICKEGYDSVSVTHSWRKI